MIERQCVKMGSGMEMGEFGYSKVRPDCNRDCANCVLVQESKELLEMYDKVIMEMIRKVEEDEKEEQRNGELRDWQRNCNPRLGLAI